MTDLASSLCGTVTVVVATYNRPDVLPVAIRSALDQGDIVAKVLVVGDHCDPRTAAVCRALSDPRVSFINLCQRFGEQSGPNNIGVALARTEFVAFLNQDDILLPGHLEGAVSHLENTGGQFFLGRAANARFTALEQGRLLPVFDQTHPARRTPGDAFRDYWMVEPASAWVFRREVAEIVGAWSPRRERFRTPIQDWFLRAWNKRIRISFGSQLSVLKITTHNHGNGDRPAYEVLHPEHENLYDLVRSISLAELRSRVEDQVRRTAGGVCGTIRRVRRTGMSGLPRAAVKVVVSSVLLGRPSAALFRYTGVDLFNLLERVRGRRRGHDWVSSSLRRTGAPPPATPDFAVVLADAAEQLPS